MSNIANNSNKERQKAMETLARAKEVQKHKEAAGGHWVKINKGYAFVKNVNKSKAK